MIWKLDESHFLLLERLGRSRFNSLDKVHSKTYGIPEAMVQIWWLDKTSRGLGSTLLSQICLLSRVKYKSDMRPMVTLQNTSQNSPSWTLSLLRHTITKFWPPDVCGSCLACLEVPVGQASCLAIIYVCTKPKTRWGVRGRGENVCCLAFCLGVPRKTLIWTYGHEHISTPTSQNSLNVRGNPTEGTAEIVL